ncbi:unnamed protein product, partial [marine sediment metagenome]
GTLDRTMYGKGTLDANIPRRSVYLTVKRSQLIPMLQLFNAPDTMQSIGSREESTIAPQALTLLNSPMARDLAMKFAQRVRGEGMVSVEQFIDRAYEIAFSRSPSDKERTEMKRFVEQLMAARATASEEAGSNAASDGAASDGNESGDDAKAEKADQEDRAEAPADAEMLALRDFCHILLCTNEFLYID